MCVALYTYQIFGVENGEKAEIAIKRGKYHRRSTSGIRGFRQKFGFCRKMILWKEASISSSTGNPFLHSFHAAGVREYITKIARKKKIKFSEEEDKKWVAGVRTYGIVLWKAQVCSMSNPGAARRGAIIMWSRNHGPLWIRQNINPLRLIELTTFL